MTTSPSINPDYPTTEPRLRAALQALVAARAAGDPAAPALVSEPDLFLRLCAAPTIGVTGTKGKTTTASLTAAILAADPAHPVVLGGQHRRPDRRAAARADPRPPRRLRAVRAAAADPVARHDRGGLHERHLGPPRPARHARGVPRVKRRLAELRRSRRRARAQRRGPGRRRLRGHRARPRSCRTGATAPLPGGLGRRRRLDRRGRRRAPGRCAGGGDGGRPGSRAAGSCRSASSAIPGAHNVSNALAAVAVGLLFGVAPRRDPRGRGGLHRRRAPPRAGRAHRRRPLRQRLAGHPARRGHRRAPRLRRAGRAHRRRPRQGRRPRPGSAAVVAERAVAAVAHRRERPGPRARASAPPGSTHVERAADTGRGRRRAPTRSPATPSPTAGPDGAGRRPCCSARPPPASTCSWTTPPAAGRSRPPSPTLGRRSPSTEGPMNLAPPIPRFGRPSRRAGGSAERNAPSDVAAVRQPDAGQGPDPGPPARAPRSPTT